VRILAISPCVPAECMRGYQVLSFYRLLHLSRKHQILLVCFGHTAEDVDSMNRLKSLGVTVQMVRWRPFVAVASMFLAMFNISKPFQCALYESPEYRDAVATAIAQFQPDLIYGITIRSLGNITKNDIPLVLDMVDSMALNLSRRRDLANSLTRVAISAEYKRIHKCEREITGRALCSFVVSKHDKEFIKDENVKVLPLGIDTSIFTKDPDESLDPTVSFTGNMFYTPNVDAVMWFYRFCWRELRLAVPGVRLIIAGNNPRREVSNLALEDGVTVTGHVESMASILNQSRLSIAPMQSGSGMQFKILEAMACGIPVVTTSIGLGDIAAVNGRDILVADTPDTFTQAVISLLQSQAMRERIGIASVQFVERNHSWHALNDSFEQTILSALRDNQID